MRKTTGNLGKQTFFLLVCVFSLSGISLLVSCANPFYDTPGAKDPADVISIAVTPPTKRLYQVGENLDLAGALVNIYYRGMEPGIDKQINLSQISGFNSRKEGIQTISVTIGGQSDHFDIALLVIPPDQQNSISAAYGDTIHVANPVDGSWKVYVFNLGGAMVKSATGARGEASYTAPEDGTYTVVVSFAKQGNIYYRFYSLQVS
jgi:hypothetical protein